VRTLLRQGGRAVEEIWVQDRRHDARIKEILGLARRHGVPIHRMDRDSLDALSPVTNHQGLVARTAVPTALDEISLKKRLGSLEAPPFVLILDGVQDPHNLGACLRSADGAGVHAVIAPKDRAVGLTPVVSKVASGAADSVPYYQVTNLARTLKWLRQDLGMWLIGTADGSEVSLFEVDLTGPLGLVLGGEGKGMRRLTRELCDRLVGIPMLGAVESLNVSVAAGICLYEAVRQRSGSR
jgi:23S rRNA (guanosine2251-2'-O)-methyltransferase